ncbi:MAG: hypothetical protein KDB22_28380 [Planctomycetales bacterium]|nr:hypothetical protein [Planctomycetales bacterium]
MSGNPDSPSPHVTRLSTHRKVDDLNRLADTRVQMGLHFAAGLQELHGK